MFANLGEHMYAATHDLTRMPPNRYIGIIPILARKFAILLVVAILLAVLLARAVHGAALAGPTTVTVQPGDTLWSIAATRYPDADTRDMVERIRQVNHMDSTLLVPGRHLTLPQP